MPRGVYTRTEKARLNIGKAGKLAYQSGRRVAPWSGKKHSDEHRKKNSVAHIGKLTGSNNPLWKGDKVSYTGLHRWVHRQLGQPSVCENCDTKSAKRYEWANLSGEYKRDTSDWARLCASCHHLIDNIYGRSSVTMKLKRMGTTK